MKTKLLLTALLSFVFCLLSSQIPQGFNYQAIARDGSGQIIANTSLPVKIAIQTSQTGGTVIWEEQHSSVTSNQFGLISFVVGTGTKLSGTAATFSAIDWNAQTLYLKTTIQYPGTTWTVMGTTQIWSVPYSMVAKDVEGPITKLGIAGTTSSLEEALFEVKNKDGQTIFAVYNEGVRVYVADGKKGAKGGFAVGGFGTAKTESQKYLYVDADSIRAYIYDDPAVKAAKGGFAVGGFNLLKNQTNEYMLISPDSIRMYIDDTGGKSAKGGFAVGGFNMSKAGSGHFLDVATDADGIINPSENRVLWYPLKNAFLTGRVLIEKPDSVGENSFASGYESKAIGDWSQALGYKAIARKDYSTAIGKNALAGKASSFAFGDSTRATGEQSYALGKKALSSGYGSFAFGSIGIDSLGAAIGTTTRSTGRYSFAVGLGALSDHQGAFAIGTNASATGDFSLSMGYNTVASGKFSTAFGIGSVASGLRSFAAGNSTASGLYSVSFGNAKASGRHSFAVGTYIVKNLLDPTLTTSASADYSAAIGVGTSAYSFCMASLGSYNIIGTGSATSWVETEPIFVVGNGRKTVGTTVSRSNALTILKNGNVGIGTANPSSLLEVNGSAHIQGSIALGFETMASGAYSLATGYRTTASGSYSTALGYYTTASASYSTATGYYSAARSTYSTAIGNTTSATGTNSFATGVETKATSPYSTSFGSQTVASGSGSITMGAFTKAKTIVSLVIGRYNDTTTASTDSYRAWYPTDPLFICGNGSADNSRTNAFTVYKNGNAYIQGNLGIGTNSPSAILHIKGNASILDLEGSDHCYMQWYPDGFAAGRKGYFGYPGATVNNITLGNEIATGHIVLLPGTSGNIGISNSSPVFKLDVNGEVASRSLNAFRLRQSSYSVILRNDNDGFYLLLTNSGDPDGTWNSLRPMAVNLSSGNVLIGINSNVGIGTYSPGYKLQVGNAGDGSQARANAWNLLSDAKLKTDLIKPDHPLEMINEINGYYFYWNTGSDKARQFGFSAQEVEKVLPEIVSKGEDGLFSLDYGKVTPLLVEAIKEQQQQIESQQRQIDELRAIVSSLTSKSE